MHTRTGLIGPIDVFEESSEEGSECHFHKVGILLCRHPFGGIIVTHLGENHKQW